MKNLTHTSKKSSNKSPLIQMNLNKGILLLFLIASIFFYPVIFQNKIALPVDALVGAHVPWTELKWPDYPAGIPIKNLEITDAFSQFYPWRSLVGDFWRNFKIPLWNNYMFSGTPFLAALHSAALYPLNIVYWFFSDIGSWNILIFTQVLLSLIFMFIFLQEVTKDKLASMFGAIAFGFSGYMIAWLEFATGGHAGLWLPLLLFIQYRYFKTKVLKYLLFIPLVIFMILTAGDFQVPFYSISIFIAFSIFLAQKSNEKLSTFLKYIAALTLGLMLSLIQWLPTFELFLQSVRVNDPYIKEYYFGIAHWEKLANFIWPDFFGNVVTRNYWGKFGYHEYLAFAGSTSLALLGFGLMTKKDSFEKFFTGILLISLLFLFPTPLAFLPYNLHLPGLGTSSASRIIFLVDFSIATLAAFALSKVRNKNLVKFKKSLFYLLLVSIGIALGLASAIIIMSNSVSEIQMLTNLKVALKNMIPSTGVLLSVFLILNIFNRFTKLKISYFKIILVLFLTIEMLRFGWKNTPFSDSKFVFPQTEITKFLQDNTNEFRIAGGIPLNLFMPYGIKSAEGYDPIYPSTNSIWYSYINSGGSGALSGRYGLIHDFSSPLIDKSSIKYVVDYKKNHLGQLSDLGNLAPGILEPKFKKVFTEGRVSVFENQDVLPIVWLTNDYVVSSSEKVLDNIIASKDNRQVVLVDNPDVDLGGDKLKYSISDFNMGFNKIDIDVTNDSKALLVLSQTMYPGWKAYVNGRETKIYNANYLFQTIYVPEGANNVSFIYDPKSFRIGLYAFALSVGIIMLGCVLLFKKGNEKY